MIYFIYKNKIWHSKHNMTFLESIKTCFKKSFDVNGRASRSEYWWFVLFYFSALILLFITNETLGLIFVLIVLPASICVTVRRLHDTNKSGFWYFITLIPYVGGFIVLYMCAMDGTIGKNAYGMPPKIKARSKKRK